MLELTDSLSILPPLIGLHSSDIMPFPDNVSYDDKYDPAMGIMDQTTANAYFESCVLHTMKVAGKSREEAEKLDRDNLGYWAGYYDEETRRRVEKLFACAHPVFGSVEEFGIPTPEQALSLGAQLGEIMKQMPIFL